MGHHSGSFAVNGLRDVVVATGPDAASYLHGQVSQNITGLAVGDSAWTLLLQPQGRVDAWMRVTRTADDTFWLDMDHGFGSAAVERLNRFKLRVDCEFSLGEQPRITLLGSPDQLGAVAGPEPEDDWMLVPFKWEGLDALDLIGPGVAAPPDFEPADLSVFEAARIGAGFPAMGAELTEQTIPAEAGVVNISADFTKGCYVGQELVARVDSRGNNTPRRLKRLSADGGVPEPGRLLTVAGAEVGVITSAAPVDDGWVGLGYIKRASDHLESATLDGVVVQLASATK